PWKDRRLDDRARTKLVHAETILRTFGLLQLEPVVKALNDQLDRRLARRYVRMADFYDRNGYAAAGDLTRFYLRIAAPSTPEAAATLDLFPWRTPEDNILGAGR
ncbi:MAG TPA: hypothetical protein VL860_05775, partial [Planctomycetota bacterium]|nr:hypothetical protein [Planctomycetota bacterium]